MRPLWAIMPVESAVTLLGLLFVGVGHISTGPAGAAIGLVGAVTCIYVMPGDFLRGALAQTISRPFLERMMFAIGFSLFITECACVIGLTLHVPVHTIAMSFLALLALAAVVRTVWSAPAALKPDDRTTYCDLKLPAFAALSLCLVIVYALGNLGGTYPFGGGFDPFEYLLNIGIADALRSTERVDDAFYIHAVVPVYPFHGIDYGYALVADLSGTTTVFAFDKMRSIWTLAAFSTLFVGIRALSQSTSYAYFGVLCASLLVITGPLGLVPAYLWGQLATTSHPVDVAMNVIAPMALTALFLLMSPAERGRHDAPILLCCMGILLSVIHQRELIQVVVYCLCGMLVLRGRKPSLTLGSAIALPICGAIAYRAWAATNVSGVSDLLDASKANLIRTLTQLDFASALRPLAPLAASYNVSFLWCLNGLMLITTAIVLVRWRALLAIRACALAMAAFMALASFAILAIPTLWVTYDELLFTPVRYVIFPMYCCSSMGFAALFSSIGTRSYDWRQIYSLMATVAVVVVVAGVARFLEQGLIPTELLVVATIGLGVFAVLAPRPKAIWSALVMPLPAAPIVVAGLLTFALATALPQTAMLNQLAHAGEFLTPMTTMMGLYRSYTRVGATAQAGSCHEVRTNILGRTLTVQTCSPSFDVVDWLHDHVSRNDILLLNPAGEFSTLGFVPVRLAAPAMLAEYRNWEQAFPRIREVIAASLDHFDGMPFYAPNESAEQRHADARALGATLVLADPSVRAMSLAAAEARPDLFHVLMDQEQWVLLVVVGN